MSVSSFSKSVAIHCAALNHVLDFFYLTHFKLGQRLNPGWLFSTHVASLRLDSVSCMVSLWPQVSPFFIRVVLLQAHVLASSWRLSEVSWKLLSMLLCWRCFELPIGVDCVISDERVFSRLHIILRLNTSINKVTINLLKDRLLWIFLIGKDLIFFSNDFLLFLTLLWFVFLFFVL